MFKRKINKLLIGLLIIQSVLVGCSTKDINNNSIIQTEEYISKNQIQEENIVDKDIVSETIKIDNNTLSKVHFIDTGNSDAILIENNNEFMLIDGGDLDDDKVVNDYLINAGVTSIKYVLATHPHADHIGALDTIVKNFDIENIFLGSGTATTKNYNLFLENIKEKNYSPSIPKENKEYSLGTGVVKFYNTQGQGGEDLNNESVLVLYSNGNDDFFFTGDAETEVELKYAPLIGDIDVYKSAHHGSRTGNSKELLDIIKPESVVILTGENSYGHPHKEVVQTFEDFNVDIYRSDEHGHIVATSTGEEITFNTNPSIILNEKVEIKEDKIDLNNVYYFTENGEKYHKTKECSTLSRSKNIINGTLEEVMDKGKIEPCSKCN